MKLKRVEIKAADLLDVVKASLPGRIPDDSSVLRLVYDPTRNTIIMLVMSEEYEEVSSIARSEVIYTQISSVKVNQFAEKGVLTERPKSSLPNEDSAENITAKELEEVEQVAE